MAASKDDLGKWFNEGQHQGAEFMIVVCDTFDWDDYPVYCSSAEFAVKYRELAGVNIQRIMEDYDFTMDCEAQLSEERALHYPQGFEP